VSQKLEMGHRVWLEIKPKYYDSESRTPVLREYEVVRANKSSAYVVEAEEIHKEQPYEIKISQKTLTGKGVLDHYKVWFSKELFLEDCAIKERTMEARKEALRRVQNMSLAELENLLEAF
jgi:hypothetical protein